MMFLKNDMATVGLTSAKDWPTKARSIRCEVV